MKVNNTLLLGLSFTIGTLAFYLWNYFFIDEWRRIGSLDIISGTIIEFFFLTTFLQFLNIRNQKENRKRMEEHLSYIESVLKERKH